ncbi:hypothetical protein LHP98_09925 [Rhodobacter sp. Har01]|uniref:hypothetical protein n=1 Tax=Rhodobacter sp. Har01 TaxID=2883999 RepID=UPI001D07C280|nr:hypothetical protein [Rhodobacter sp. Har01]MCB6178448.1 hypothetical protein [Rhodobacter sp. Har01]
MVTVSPFKSYTAGLFGLPSKVNGPAQTAPSAAAAMSSAQRSATTTIRSSSHNDFGGYEAYKDPEFVRDPAAAIAKSEAAMAVWEAGELKFEQENGFRRKVNSMALGAYAHAQSGRFGVPSFRAADEAADYLESLVGSMGANASTIRFSTIQADSLARPEVAAAYGEVKTEQLLAMHADQHKAAEMDLFVLNAVLSKAFGTSGPVTRQDGGKVSFVAQEFSFQGKTYARLSEDGVVTRLDTAGLDQRL